MITRRIPSLHLFYGYKEKKCCPTTKMNRSDILSWGPSGWNFLHVVSLAYPVSPSMADRVQMYGFLYAFANALPCRRCRVHFVNMLNLHLSTLSSDKLDTRESLVRFVFDAHNMVNTRLRAPEISFVEFLDRYGNPSLHQTTVAARAVPMHRKPRLPLPLSLAAVLCLLVALAATTRRRSSPLAPTKTASAP